MFLKEIFKLSVGDSPLGLRKLGARPQISVLRDAYTHYAAIPCSL